MTIECDEINPGNSINVKLVGLQEDDSDPASTDVDDYINDATVTVTAKAAGSPMAGATAVAMPYVAGSRGRYKGVLPHTVAFVAETEYTIEVTATAAGVGVGFWSVTKVAKLRGAC